MKWKEERKHRRSNRTLMSDQWFNSSSSLLPFSSLLISGSRVWAQTHRAHASVRTWCMKGWVRGGDRQADRQRERRAVCSGASPDTDWTSPDAVCRNGPAPASPHRCTHKADTAPPTKTTQWCFFFIVHTNCKNASRFLVNFSRGKFLLSHFWLISTRPSLETH